MGAVVGGGRPARPWPSTRAPRPIPLFSVVRIGKGRPSRQAPAAREDTPRLGRQRFRSGFGEELRDGEERATLGVDAPLLVGAGAAAEHLLDERELARAAEPPRRRLRELDEVPEGLPRRPLLVARARQQGGVRAAAPRGPTALLGR